MRLSDEELRWMQARLAQRYAAAGCEVQRELERQLAALTPDHALLTSWCYAASPLSDWANYDFSLFSACAACPVSLPMPAMTHIPCGSMKICPSVHSLLPTGLPKAS